MQAPLSNSNESFRETIRVYRSKYMVAGLQLVTNLFDSETSSN